jgi:archaellum component FlaC
MSDVRDLTPAVLIDIRNELRTLNARVDDGFNRVDARLESVDARLESVDARLGRVEVRVGNLERQMTTVVGILGDNVATEIESLKTRVTALERSRDSTDA